MDADRAAVIDVASDGRAWSKQHQVAVAIGIHRRLYQADTEIIVAAEPILFEGGALTWRNVFTGRVRDIASVSLLLWSTPRIANDALGKPLQRAGIETYLVGDCVAPRNLLCAIHEGEAAAMRI